MTTVSEAAPEVLQRYYRILAAGIDAFDADGELRTLLIDDLEFEGPIAGKRTGAAGFCQGVKGFIATVSDSRSSKRSTEKTVPRYSTTPTCRAGSSGSQSSSASTTARSRHSGSITILPNTCEKAAADLPPARGRRQRRGMIQSKSVRGVPTGPR